MKQVLQMKRKPFTKVGTLIFALTMSACSVVMAASGSKEPDLARVTKGATRYQVEKELGPPIETFKTSDGSIDTYSYKLGDAPSAGRAVMHCALDVVTLCLWEYVGFPMEIAQSGNAYRLAVEYGPDEKVKDVHEPKS